MFRLWWIAADRQAAYDMGGFDTEALARDAIPAATRELLSQCADDDERQSVRAGYWAINPERGA